MQLYGSAQELIDVLAKAFWMWSRLNPRSELLECDLLAAKLDTTRYEAMLLTLTFLPYAINDLNSNYDCMEIAEPIVSKLTESVDVNDFLKWVSELPTVEIKNAAYELSWIVDPGQRFAGVSYAADHNVPSPTECVINAINRLTI